jgi:glycerophosphoryl diester phosphodiesterase
VKTLNKVLAIAHRGASGYLPENTLPAFHLAVEQGADAVELDVHLSADGHPVVMHDPTVDRTTDGHGYIKDMTLADLRRLRCQGQKIPLLEDVLEELPREVLLAVEVKNGPVFYPGIEATILATLSRHDRLENTLVISFDHRVVKRLRKLSGGVKTGILFVCHPVRPVAMAKAANSQCVLPHWAFVTKSLVNTVHKAGLPVFAWVADDEDTMRQLLALGVDGIATNYPDRLVGILRGS